MHRMATRNGQRTHGFECVQHLYEWRICVQHSIRIDSFCTEDELFFESHEAKPVAFEGAPTLEIDTVETQPATAEQLAHLTRFRRPVAWIVGAMGALSLLALGQHGYQQIARREVGAHIGSSTGTSPAAAAKNVAAVSALP